MKRSNRLLGWCIVAVGVLGTSGLVHAQGSPILNRRIGEVAVLPSSTGGWDFEVLWTVEANGTSAGANMGTTVMVFVGAGAEVPSGTKTVGVNLDFTDGICGITGCIGGCGGGFIDGVFNTMLCLEDPPCPAGNCDCTCRFPWITTSLPGIDLEPGDEVTVLLVPATGSMPENDPSDDGRTFIFQDDPIFWNLELLSAQAVPTSVPNLYDVVIDWSAALAGIADTVVMSPVADLVVNGTTAAQASFCSDNPWIISPGNPCTAGGTCFVQEQCATGSCAGSNTILRCKITSCFEGAHDCCACTSDPEQLVIPGVALLASDRIVVILRPAPGALPTLPGLDVDDTADLVLPCAGDLNGDGTVDGSDLGLMLGAWGTAGPGDLNGDGNVDGSDLGLLLGAWGDCFPV